MCNPQLIVMAAASAYSLREQRVNARRQQRFFAEARAEQDRQIGQQRNLDIENRARRARAERARLRALSAETGLTGITPDTLLRDVDFQSGRDIAVLEQNRDNQLRDSRLRHQSNLNMISQPDYIGTALNTGLQIHSAGQNEGLWGGGP